MVSQILHIRRKNSTNTAHIRLKQSISDTPWETGHETYPAVPLEFCPSLPRTRNIVMRVTSAIVPWLVPWILRSLGEIPKPATSLQLPNMLLGKLPECAVCMACPTLFISKLNCLLRCLLLDLICRSVAGHPRYRAPSALFPTFNVFVPTILYKKTRPSAS
jgi:hypothetical protein